MTFQLGAPLLDGCVLAVLAHGDAYGYHLTQQIKSVIDISESTLYPVLRRLEKEHCLMVYDQPYQGRNRRYYVITEAGRELLKTCRTEWAAYRSNIDSLLWSVGGEKEKAYE